MSLLFRRVASTDALDLLARERAGRVVGSVTVTSDSAMRHSAVWAALRLRANLISSMPVDLFRRIAGQQVEVPKSPLLRTPGALHIGGQRVSIADWLYATQVDLDRCGNAFGLVTEWSGLSLPSRIDLTAAEDWTVAVRNQAVEYRYRGEKLDRGQVWHEREYVVAGLPVGLSPVANAALAIGQYASAQQFTLDWFGNSAVPASRLKNTAKTVTPAQADDIKARFKASVQAGDVFVHGNDWDFDMLAANASQSEFLETQKWSVADVARFFDVPGDMIDAETSTGSITYANVTQRNLQLMVTSLGPAIKRREDALSAAMPSPQYVKLNTDAVLRMDPKTRYEMLAIGVDKRAVTPNEWRELDNRPPLTPEQEAEFARLFANRSPDTAPVPKG